MLRIYIVCLFICCSKLALAYNDIGITVEGDQNLCNNSPTPIVTNVTINGQPLGLDNLDEVYIQISSGYDPTNDILILQGTHPNITPSWSSEEGQLTLTGPATFGEFETAISNVVFSTTQTNFTADREFNIRLTDVDYLVLTGHHYRYVVDSGITWTEAKAAAEAQSLLGLQGYLVTVTSIEEARFIATLSSEMGWIGASDRQQEGKWIWETGPEVGSEFWNGIHNGSAPNGAFSLWNVGQPNNFQNEDYAHVTHSNIGSLGSWNDLPDTGGDLDTLYYPAGYIVEFGGLLTDPDISLVAEAVIRTPQLEFDDINLCEPSTIQIQTTTNTNQLLWFESETATTPIYNGFDYDVFIDATTTFWVLPQFDDCTNGIRYPITVEVYGYPIANNISVLQCDDAVNDGISSFNLTAYFDAIVAGNTSEAIENLQIDFYNNSALTQLIETPESYENNQTPELIYAYVYNTESQCSSVAEITLEVSLGNVTDIILETCEDQTEDGLSTFTLTNANTQILENSPTNATILYYESYEDALLQINTLDNSYNNTQPYLQIIYARVDVDGGCYAINEVDLKVNGLPPIDDFKEVYYCLNTYPQTITIDSGIVTNTNLYTYNWSTNETTSSIEINEVGDYQVNVTDALGCAKEQTITVSSSEIATVQSITVTDITENNTIVVMVLGDGEYVFALDAINGIYQASNTFENVAPGVHTVYIKDVKNNCGIVSGSVSVLGFPKFFTPNNDTFNDTWQVEGYSTEFPVASTVEIYDRYGKLIASLNPQKPSWDGTLNDKKLPQDDYWFVAEFSDGRVARGHFTLKR